jgi:hypothetical protein
MVDAGTNLFCTAATISVSYNDHWMKVVGLGEK